MNEMGIKKTMVVKMPTLARDESGGVAVTFALALTALCGFMALALDLGHMVKVRAELQRTADAAALAGAMGLAPYTGSTPNLTPNWTNATTKAHSVINDVANLTDGQRFSLTDGTIICGYWYLEAPSGYTQPINNTTRPTTTAAYVPEPAVTVTLSRNVTLSLAPLIGISSPRSVSATATAILPEVYTIIGPNGHPPIAVSKDTVFNNVSGTLVIDITDQDIKIQSNKGEAGWFNWDGGNSVPDVLEGTKLTTEEVTDPVTNTYHQIYLSPGTKATLTGLVPESQVIVLPIVETVEKKEWRDIIGFAGFKVETLDSNSMTGHFVSKYYDPNVKPTAIPDTLPPSQMVWGTPKLVK
jgi:Flp pilus assembly protein TadG